MARLATTARSSAAADPPPKVGAMTSLPRVFLESSSQKSTNHKKAVTIIHQFIHNAAVWSEAIHGDSSMRKNILYCFLLIFAISQIGCKDEDIQIVMENGHNAVLNHNNKLAIKWFTKGAKRGNGKAMFELGKVYEFQGNSVEATKWFLAGSEKNDSDANEKIGEYYFFGKGGLAHDWSKAADYFARSISPDACYYLGACLENGTGRSIDLEKALQAYRAAALLGHNLAKLRAEALGAYLARSSGKNEPQEIKSSTIVEQQKLTDLTLQDYLQRYQSHITNGLVAMSDNGTPIHGYTAFSQDVVVNIKVSPTDHVEFVAVRNTSNRISIDMANKISMTFVAAIMSASPLVDANEGLARVLVITKDAMRMADQSAERQGAQEIVFHGLKTTCMVDKSGQPDGKGLIMYFISDPGTSIQLY